MRSVVRVHLGPPGQTDIPEIRCRVRTIGYKIDEEKFYHLDPLTAPLVLEAFQQYDNGDKMVEIVNFLNDKGVYNGVSEEYEH